VHSWRADDAAFGTVHGAENVSCASGARVSALESVAGRLAILAVDAGDAETDPSSRAETKTRSKTRRSKALRALSSLTRSHFPSRRAFFAADGAAHMKRLFGSEDDSTRARAFALATDFWTAPDVAGGPEAKGYPPGRQDEEVQLARDLVPRLIENLHRGSRDSREKAMYALDAAVARGGVQARDAAEKGRAAEALVALAKHLEDDAASSPATEEHALELAGEARRFAGKMRVPGGEASEGRDFEL
jgi:hypothetical protein